MTDSPEPADDDIEVQNSENQAEPMETTAKTATTATMTTKAAVASDLETANLIEGYHVIAEWIRFADAKAAVVLTVGGAVAGLVIPTLRSYLNEESAVHPTAWWTAFVATLFAIWLFMLLLSGIYAFRCILPFRRKGRHPALAHSSHFHPAAICARFNLDDVDQFIDECEAMGDSGLRREVSGCLLIDSHISGVKYARVTTAIRLMGFSSIIALVYLVAIQF